MFKTVARVLLLRVLPRRILPVVTFVEAVLLLRGIRNRSRVKADPSSGSRTALPAKRPATDWGATTSPPPTERPTSR